MNPASLGQQDEAAPEDGNQDQADRDGPELRSPPRANGRLRLHIGPIAEDVTIAAQVLVGPLV
jgi:hypothetical protein